MRREPSKAKAQGLGGGSGMGAEGKVERGARRAAERPRGFRPCLCVRLSAPAARSHVPAPESHGKFFLMFLHLWVYACKETRGVFLMAHRGGMFYSAFSALGGSHSNINCFLEKEEMKEELISSMDRAWLRQRGS